MLTTDNMECKIIACSTKFLHNLDLQVYDHKNTRAAINIYQTADLQAGIYTARKVVIFT